MPSKAFQIAARITAVLSAAATGAIAVYQDREDAITRAESPVILVELDDEDSTRLGSTPDVDIDLLRIQVTVCVRSEGWQAIADAVRVAAHAALIADAQLQTMTNSSLRRDRAQWRPASTDIPFGLCNQIYKCKYATFNKGLDL